VSTGVVEHLDKTPERWAFLLRAEDGTAANIELRGKVYGTLADGHEVELLESRTITDDEVVVARRLRNLTLGSAVTARQPGRGSKIVAFLVPQSIWTPIGGMGAAVFGYCAAGAAGDDPKDVEAPSPPPSDTATATATPEPGVPADGDGFPVVPVVLVVAVLVAVAVFFVARGREPEGAAPQAAPPRSGGAGRFALVVVVGVLVGIGLNLLIT
jgi:hypothetical protein